MPKNFKPVDLYSTLRDDRTRFLETYRKNTLVENGSNQAVIEGTATTKGWSAHLPGTRAADFLLMISPFLVGTLSVNSKDFHQPSV